MSSGVFIIYIRLGVGLREYISSVAQCEELAQLICQDMRNHGFSARYQWEPFWGKDSLDYWLKKCGTQQSSM